jgi:hypothetical protein
LLILLILVSTSLSKTLNRATNKFLKEHGYVRNIVTMYNRLFSKVISNRIPNNNIFYNSLWDKYSTDKDKLINLSNIHILINNIQSNIIDNIKTISRDKIDDSIKDLQLIKGLYDDILLFIINNTTELPQEYGRDNIFLKEIMDIIIHCSKHIIFSNLYNALTRSLAEFFKSITPSKIKEVVVDDTFIGNLYADPKNEDNFMVEKEGTKSLEMFKKDEQYSDYISSLIKEIMASDYKNDEDLNIYILETMPRICTKLKLDIYENEDDEDRIHTSLDEIFIKIVDMLKQSYVVSIDDTSSIIRNTKDYLLPYYKDLINITIPLMKSVIDNYNRYILNESGHIDMIIELLKGVKKDMDNQ